MVMIPIYGQVKETMNEVLYGRASKTMEESLFGLEEGMTYTGGELIAQIDFFMERPDRVVTVTAPDGSYSYIDSGYDAGSFMIELYDEYSFQMNPAEGYTEYIYTLN